MSALAPDLFQRRFQDFMEIGRARLRSLAPDWTDHNAHDPGITLLELLAWVGEAQLYSLSRLRRDERAAYAALLGLVPTGTQGARGLIWPDPLDPSSPAASFARSVVIPEDAVVHVLGTETPTFRPTRRLLWAPGRIQRLETRRTGGPAIEHTRSNERGAAAFLPLGESAGRRDVLALSFACRDDAGLFGPDRARARGALWPIGVRAAAPAGGAAGESTGEASAARSPLEATLVTDQQRFSLQIVSDSSAGLLTSGVLLLDLDTVAGNPKNFTLELRAPNGLARPPRLLRIEPNVLPIQQGRFISRELQPARGTPDWGFALAVPGLRFGAGEEPVAIEVSEAGGLRTWQRCERLSDEGPEREVYEFDALTGQVSFGNGVNGRVPPLDAHVFASYAVSDAEQGSVARNRKWVVAGFAGSFGVNLDPVGGGAAPAGWIDQRREARRRSRSEHALVSSGDIVEAALALPLLEVTRAWVVAPQQAVPRTGAVRLVAMRSRTDAAEPEQIPETARWLNAIRGRLVARMPLGTRLVVTAPRYVEFSIRIVLEAKAGLDPVAVRDDVERQLQRRLALVESTQTRLPRPPGVPLTRRDLAAWLRATAGVQRVIDVELRAANGQKRETLAVPADGLPKRARSSIEVRRPEPRRAP